jgi:hypothetical protein
MRCIYYRGNRIVTALGNADDVEPLTHTAAIRADIVIGMIIYNSVL